MAQSQDFNRQTGTPVTGAVATSYVDWPAILAGTVLAMALSFVLLTFGSAIGFSVTSFEPHEGASLFWLSVASGLWFIWVAITSFGAGGYIAGRLRRPVAGASLDEVEVRDGAHGLLVWATGAIVGAMLAASGISGAIGAATSTAGTAAQTAAQAVGGDLDVISQRLMRSATGGDPAIESEARDIILRGLADGDVSAEDRDYVASIVAQRADIPQEEARARVDAAITDAKALYDKAVDTAEKVRVGTAIAAFLVAATMLCAGAAAYMAAVAGGDHRDRGIGLDW